MYRILSRWYYKVLRCITLSSVSKGTLKLLRRVILVDRPRNFEFAAFYSVCIYQKTVMELVTFKSKSKLQKRLIFNKAPFMK